MGTTASHGVATTTMSQAGGVLVGGAGDGRAGAASASCSAATTWRHAPSSRDPIVTDAPGGGQPQAEPPTERPGPPEDPDVHRNTLAQRPRALVQPDLRRSAGRSDGAARVGSPAVSPSNGLLSGKRILVTGVLTDASLAFGVARLAQAQGAEVVLSGAGRGLSLTRRTARKLDAPVDVIEIDVTDPAHLRAAADDLTARWGRLDGILHAIGFAPQECLGGDILRAEWERGGRGPPGLGVLA